MRLIDADALINRIVFHSDLLGDQKEVFEDEINAEPSIEPERLEGHWIPCSERLPKAGVRYQVTFKSGEVGYADFRNKIFLMDGSTKANVWEIERYYEDDGEVIAWMPLPEPYMEESEKDG